MEKYSVKIDFETLGITIGHKTALKNLETLGKVDFILDKENKTITYIMSFDKDRSNEMYKSITTIK